MENTNKEHWSTIKRILKYANVTSNVVLCYGGSYFTVRCYVDLDYVNDLDKK